MNGLNKLAAALDTIADAWDAPEAPKARERSSAEREKRASVALAAGTLYRERNGSEAPQAFVDAVIDGSDELIAGLAKIASVESPDPLGDVESRTPSGGERMTRAQKKQAADDNFVQQLMSINIPGEDT